MTINQAPKLTKAQAVVVAHLQDGYELGAYNKGLTQEAGVRCRLQKGGIGKGGPTVQVSPSVFKALLNVGYLVQTGGDYRFSKYSLNDTLFPSVPAAEDGTAA